MALTDQDLTPEMAEAAEQVARAAINGIDAWETWGRQFAAGVAEADRPALYQEYQRTIMHALVDMANDRLRTTLARPPA